MIQGARREQQAEWMRRQMPRLAGAVKRLPSLEGFRIAFSMHLDPKMIPFVEGVLARSGAVYLTTCNPDTVRDDVVEHLRARGAEGTAYRGMSMKEYRAAADAALEWGPTHLCEMGAELSAAWVRRGGGKARSGSGVVGGGAAGGGVRASLEATGSGITRMESLDLDYPVFNWDDLPVKEGLHNRHMVGLTAWHTFFARTGLTLHEKTVLVIGYGDVGAGVADGAKAYGAHVMVAERDPARRLRAAYAGWETAELPEAAARADVIATATGADGVVGRALIDRLPDGAFLLNVGHRPEEIDVTYLRSHDHREIIPFVEEISLGRRKVYLLAGGSMLNLVAGAGDSLNAFDVTLAVLTEALGFLVHEGSTYPAGLHVLPDFVWRTAVS
ncbi:MAG: NAD(P)-dependent oxidoreductase [Spirochaetaceae bacterium]